MKNTNDYVPLENNMQSLVLDIDRKLSILSSMKLKNDVAVRDLLGVASSSENKEVSVETWNGTEAQMEEVRQYKELLGDLNKLMAAYSDNRTRVFKAATKKNFGEELIVQLKEKITKRLKDLKFNPNLGFPSIDSFE